MNRLQIILLVLLGLLTLAHVLDYKVTSLLLDWLADLKRKTCCYSRNDGLAERIDILGLDYEKRILDVNSAITDFTKVTDTIFKTENRDTTAQFCFLIAHESENVNLRRFLVRINAKRGHYLGPYKERLCVSDFVYDKESPNCLSIEMIDTTAGERVSWQRKDNFLPKGKSCRITLRCVRNEFDVEWSE